MRRASLLSVVAMLCLITTLFARSQSSTEQKVVHLISLTLELEMNMNGGQLPTNWNQLQFGYEYWNRALARRGIEPIQAIYVFVPTNLPMIGQPTGDVVVARTKPVKEENAEGRYVIIRQPNGDCEFNWISEEVFQKMLARAVVKLPEPDAEAVRAAEEALKRFRQEEERMRKAINREGWKVRAILLWRDVKGWFVSSGNASSPGGASGQQAVGTIKPIPVALALLAFLGFVALVFMWFRRRQRSS